ncbi:MAG: extracellular matrix regulator RemB [Candidatus Scatovivens sp.]
MYLHIYKDCVINNKEIIGIFNIDKLKNSNININFLKQLEENEDIINLNNNNKEKNLIITNKDNNTKGYISNININTIKKRIL